ncbi:glycerophosphodiester phosphodiesterase family protein [Streptomyces sp. NBS 14/10]|uniref:glycerophosphodiester phosphodiesterase n=1 Tax=Streptomyces sp. NBS 14/10 TaxID=1945643 RepID=UPI000B7DEBDC|nr:glycerophosphodiester phosphodiesterase family protein [Streptomyces sp. NBS 14/10]KAK1178417.1 glycerophosphodiester phosphodiesterase family protein [Streptomyces sp. NBS 14/10]NUP38318.1 glycerophosphodiester phosphodiesterase [Streptomyces sp.]NUS84252.1 glycerophosphodiester phosphodiesterase [Streptomyces sp.]
MRIRPAAALTGALIGMSALFLSPAAARADQADRIDHLDHADQVTDQSRHTVTVAHRGASAYAPENTLAAVDAADDLGITWVENDVQRTKDGELIVMHDTTLNRTTDVEEVFPDRAPWKISDFNLDEIQQLDAGSWFSPKFAGEGVPTLEDYLDRVEHNHQKLLLELKAPELYPDIERQTLRELRRAGWLDRRHVQHKLIVQSFGADAVKQVHDLRPDVKTGFLGTPAVEDLETYAEFADQINPSYKTIDADYVDAVHEVDGAHGRPFEVYAWTVNDAQTAVEVAHMGVNGIITNNPDVVRDALEDAGYEVPGAPAAVS